MTAEMLLLIESISFLCPFLFSQSRTFAVWFERVHSKVLVSSPPLCVYCPLQRCFLTLPHGRWERTSGRTETMLINPSLTSRGGPRRCEQSPTHPRLTIPLTGLLMTNQRRERLHRLLTRRIYDCMLSCSCSWGQKLSLGLQVKESRVTITLNNSYMLFKHFNVILFVCCLLSISLGQRWVFMWFEWICLIYCKHFVIRIVLLSSNCYFLIFII